MAIEAGTLIGGFRVEGLIGKGGMASVYRAIQLRLQRAVALKILAPALAADEQFVQRFQLEGVNAASLEHPNIVPVYEAGDEGHHVYLAMKFVDGKTLASHISEHRVLTADDALKILADVGRALDYAKELGYVHRDVKPGNILLERSGHVYLSDFGLSKAIGKRGLTGTGQWMGTLEYMAPEQAGGGFLDYRADLYALACVAFECLTGDTPYTGDSPLAVMMAHASHDVPSATARNLSLPPGVDLVMRRALAKDPNERYTSALTLVESLAAALEERRLTSVAEPADDVRRFGKGSAPPQIIAGRQAVAASPAPPSHPAPSISVCPACFGTLDPDDVFCGGCGTRVFRCRTCRGPVVAGDRFCQHCGTPTA